MFIIGLQDRAIGTAIKALHLINLEAATKLAHLECKSANSAGNLAHPMLILQHEQNPTCVQQEESVTDSENASELVDITFVFWQLPTGCAKTSAARDIIR